MKARKSRLEAFAPTLTTAALCLSVACTGVISRSTGINGGPSGQGGTNVIPIGNGGGQTGSGSGSGSGSSSGSGAVLGTGSGAVVGTGSGGVIGGDGSGGAGAITGMRSTPGDLPLPRLSHDEYVQTVQDLLKQVMPSDATGILTSIVPMTNDLPLDALVTISTEKHGGFSRADQSEQQQYSDVPFSVATALGTTMVSSKTRIATLFGTCSNAGATVDTACLQTFIKSFGEIALRHPLSADDVTFYASTATTNPVSTADMAAVIAVMLTSPRFLYRVESGDQPVANTPDQFTLDAWELASRLSYHFWGTMPDQALRDAAKSGSLMTTDGYSAQVNRLAADARTDATMRTFFQQWLWPLIELPALDSRASDVVFKAFAGSNLPSATLRDHMVKDVLDAASWVTSHDGTLSDLLTNRMSFARDADLAAIYGVAAWNGQGTPATLPMERAGLLTRAAFLSTGTINTRPVMKGVFIREGLLCDGIPPPPANAVNVPIVVKDGQTTRQVIESVTEVSQPCMGCHTTVINPLGFATENFDSLGRTRTAQAFFDSTGKMTSSTPVDTTSVPQVNIDDKTPSTGAGDLTQLVTASGKVEACFARKFFRFVFRRIEDDSNTSDASAIAGINDLAKKGKLSEVFRGVVERPEFKQRVIQVTQ